MNGPLGRPTPEQALEDLIPQHIPFTTQDSPWRAFVRARGPLAPSVEPRAILTLTHELRESTQESPVKAPDPVQVKTPVVRDTSIPSRVPFNDPKRKAERVARRAQYAERKAHYLKDGLTGAAAEARAAQDAYQEVTSRASS